MVILFNCVNCTISKRSTLYAVYYFIINWCALGCRDFYCLYKLLLKSFSTRSELCAWPIVQQLHCKPHSLAVDGNQIDQTTSSCHIIPWCGKRATWRDSTHVPSKVRSKLEFLEWALILESPELPAQFQKYTAYQVRMLLTVKSLHYSHHSAILSTEVVVI